jgi:hypothetical protein
MFLHHRIEQQLYCGKVAHESCNNMVLFLVERQWMLPVMQMREHCS